MDWIPTNEAEVGVIYAIRQRDALGAYDVPGRFFLNDDGLWYMIDPPMQVNPPHRIAIITPPEGE